MNRRNVRIGAVVCSAGVVIGGITLATSALGAGTPIGLNSGATAPVVANLGTSSTAQAAASYALKISDTSINNTKIGLESAPSGGTLAYELGANNAAASSGGFTALNGGVREVQNVAVTATGGTFTLTYGANTTTALAYNATTTQVQTALNTLTSIINAGSVVVSGTPGTNYVITFNYAFDADQITVNPGSLTGGTATATTTTPGVAPTGSGSSSVGGGTLTNSDLLYVTGDVPGDYKFRIYQDNNGNGSYDSADERSSDLVTLKVYDAVANTSATGDDVTITPNAATPVDIGRPVTAELPFSKPLSLTDARGATALGSALSALTKVDLSGAGGFSVTDGATSFSNGRIIYSSAAATAPAGTATLRADLLPSGSGNSTTAFGATSVVINNNTIAAMTLDTAAGANTLRGTTNATIRTGTADTTYTLTAVNSTPAPASGRVVYFTIGAGTTGLANLKVDGVAVPTNGIVSATTDGGGKATIKVTSATPTAGKTYTVSAASNGVTADVDTTTGGIQGTLTATYANAARADIVTDATLNGEIGKTVTVSGTLVDQFGEPLTPDGAQATINLDRNASTFATADYTQTVSISGGKFQFTVPDVTSNTTARQDAFQFSISNPNGVVGGTTAGTINWISSIAVNSITLNGLGPISSFPVPTGTAPLTLATNSATNAVDLTGVIKNSDGVVLPGASFTVSGGTNSGVYFLDATGKAVSSFTGRTTGSGLIDDGAGPGTNAVRVFFTKTGAQTLTVTSGGKSVTTGAFNVAGAVAGQAYRIELQPAVGLTQKNVLVKGKVLDAFGNGVAGVTLSALDFSDASLGSWISGLPTTDSAGNFSRVFLSTDATGSTKIVAQLTSSTSTPADASTTNYAGTGLTIGKPADDVETSLRIIAEGVTTQAIERKIGPGAVAVSGVSAPNSTVDIYSRPLAGGSYVKVKSVTADDQGAYNTTIDIQSAVSVKAVSGSKESTPISIAMNSKLQASAVPLGDGKVKISIAGYPGKKDGGIALYEDRAGKLVKVAYLRSDSRGVGKVTLTMTPGTKTIKAIYQAPGTNQGSVVLSFTVD